MAQLGDDCYFFCTSSCVKGPACPFRHVESAKTAQIICQHWQMGQCARPMCKFRHATFEIPVSTKSEIPCYWESQPIGCKKPTCIYKHFKPRPGLQETGNDGKTDTSVQSTTESSVKPATTDFVVPQVKPVVIQPADSEDSNCSPVKTVSSSPHVKRPVNTVNAGKEMLNLNDTIKNISSVAGEKKDESEKTEVKEDVSKTTEESITPVTPAPKKKKKVIVKKIVKKKKVASSEAGATGESKAAPKKKTIVKPKSSSGTPQTGPLKKKVVKAKVTPKSAPAVKTASQGIVRKSVKDRLGLNAVKRPTAGLTLEKSGRKSSSGSDSDDSIENVNVLSMEEILRRKALESMMKKRADEGKELLPRLEPQKSNIIKLNKSRAPSRPLPPQPPARLPKPVRSASSYARGRPNPRLQAEELEESSESSSEEEETSSSSESSSESESESEESSESEPEVRRVIVDVESEKAARKRAKASLLSKQKHSLHVERSLHHAIAGRIAKKKAKEPTRLLQGALGAALGKKVVKTGKKRTINVNYESDEIVQHVKKPLSIRERLGNPVQRDKPVDVLERAARLSEASDAGVHSAGEGSPHRVTSRTIRSHSDGEEEEEGQDLMSIKVKTLEEIRQEKMRQLASSQDNGEPKNLSPTRTVDATKISERIGRQVIVTDSEKVDMSPLKTADEQKKAKRRPWRSQKLKTGKSFDNGDEDSRTAISEESQSPPRAVDVEEKAKPEPEVEESPFEQLKKRALLRKLERLQQEQLAKSGQASEKPTEKDNGSNNGGAALESAEVEKTEEKDSKSRKHKHKHKHKQNKKSKGERQIYMPPGMKNSAVAFVQPTRQADEGSADNSNDSADVSIEGGSEGVASKRPVMSKKGPHPIGAAWAAGLSLSAKGTAVRRPEVKPFAGVGSLQPQEKVAQQTTIMQRLNKPIISMSKTAPSVQNEDSESSGGVVIKSFSEIMAEKRRRRLELQGKKPVEESSTMGAGSSASNSPVKSENIKPRVPITPIIFDKESPFKETRPTQGFTSSTQRPVTTSSNPPVAKQVAPLSFHGDAAISVSSEQTNPVFSGLKQASDSLAGKKKLFKKKKSIDIVPSSAFETEKSKTPQSVNMFDASGLDLEDSSLSLSVVEEEADQRVGRSKMESTSEQSAVKHRSPSIGHEVPKKKSRLSLDDELNLLDEEEEVIPVEVQEESFDDLLQDIDDLLA